MKKLNKVYLTTLFILLGTLASGYASELKTVIEQSGFYEIKIVPKQTGGEQNFTLTAGSRKTYTRMLTQEVVPLGFLSKGAVVDMQTETPATLSLNRAGVKTVKYTKSDAQIGKTVLHQVKRAGFYGLANAILSGNSVGTGLDVRIAVRKQLPLLRQQVKSGTMASFDTEIGWLEPGDVIELEMVGESEANVVFAYDLLFLAHTDIQEQINSALSRKESIAYIYPGRYYVTPERPAVILLKNQSNFTVHAYGVEMIIRKPSQRILEVRGCTDVAIRGFVADNDPLLFPQGTIVDVAKNGAWIDMELHEGYPIPIAKTADRAMVHDATTLYRKKFAKDFNPTAVEELGSGRYRISTAARGINEHGWTPGDYVSLTNPGTGSSCFIYGSTRFQLEDVTLHSCARHFSIFEKYSSENRYRNVTMKPGSRPLLATKDRLRSTHSDGIHSKYATVGPCIEDCHFEALGDDAIAINGSFSIVMETSEGNKVKVATQEESLHVGDRLRFYTNSGDMLYRKILHVMSSPAEPAEMRKFVTKHYSGLKYPGGYKHVASIELDSSTHVSTGNLLANLDRNGNGFVVRNNRIKNNRARGVLIKASDGIVEGNHISDLALSGIILAAEAQEFIEADMVSDVVVRNNTIESVNRGYLNPGRVIQAGGIVIVFADQKIKGHRNIRIEGNRFINVPGVNILINNATGVKVNGNVFQGSHYRQSVAGENVGVDNSALIWMDHVDDVTFGGGRHANFYRQIGSFADQANLIRYTENVENIKGEIYISHDKK